MALAPLPKGLHTHTDGRRQRSEQGRRRVALAMVELTRASGAPPSMDDIAKHAQVSRRSAFRYFEDMAALELAALRLLREEVQKEHPLPHPRGALRERMEAVVEHRANTFRYMAPLLRLAQVRRADHVELDRELTDIRFGFREHLMVVFTGELARLVPERREDQLHALEMVCGFDAYNALRAGQGCQEEQARRITLDLMDRLLAP